MSKNISIFFKSINILSAIFTQFLKKIKFVTFFNYGPNRSVKNEYEPEFVCVSSLRRRFWVRRWASVSPWSGPAACPSHPATELLQGPAVSKQKQQINKINHFQPIRMQHF